MSPYVARHPSSTESIGFERAALRMYRSDRCALIIIQHRSG
jgi:hypothetical protein